MSTSRPTINANANSLTVGSYSDIFDNTTSGTGNTSRSVDLTVFGSPTIIVAAASVNSSGFVGGPFSPSTGFLTVSNSGTATLSWTVNKTAAWMTLFTTGGSIAVGTNATLTVTINSAATNLGRGTYTDTLWFTDAWG